MKKSVFVSLIILFSVCSLMFGEGQQESGSSTSVNKAKELLGDEYYTSNPGDRNFELPTSGVGPQIKTDVTADDKYLLACMVKNSTNPYMVKMLEGAKKAADDLGCEIITIGPTRADNIEEQIRIMEDLIQKGVKGMVLHPSDSNGIMPGVRKATAKKIPVATIGTPAAEPTFLRTGVNYYQTGIIVGSRVAEALNGKGNVIVLEGAPGAQNGQERLQGIKDELGKHSGIEIIASQTANWNRVQGMQVMENLLQRFDDVDAVIGCNDEMAIGAIQAIKAAGLSGEVVVAGFDANKDGCLAIQNGDMMLSYNTDPFGSAYLAVSYLVQNLNASEEIPPRYFIPFPDKEENPVIDKSNVHGFMEQDAWWIQ